MKLCQTCGETYRDHVDFCFIDGEILMLADADAIDDAASSEPSSELDAPLPRMVQGPQAAAASASTSNAETMPLPRPGRVAEMPAGGTVPAANTPVDDEETPVDAEAVEETPVEDAPLDETPAPLGTHDDVDPEATEVLLDEEADDLAPPDDEAHRQQHEPEAGRRGASNAATVPPPDLREPMPVAPLSSASAAETVPFERPQRDVTTPVSPPPVARAPQAPPPLHIPPPPKRRGAPPPPQDPQDRTGWLWFGAILLGVAIAVPFLIGVAVILALVVGINPTDDSSDAVAVAPRPVPEASAPAPAPMQVEQPEPAPPVPTDAALEVGDPVPDNEMSQPKPAPTGPRPQPAEPNPASPVMVTFALEPSTATVAWKGKALRLSGDSTAMVSPPPQTFVVSAPGHCAQQITWDGPLRKVTARLPPGCDTPQPAEVAQPKPSPASGPLVKVFFTSPIGARLSIDNVDAGTLPLNLDLPAGGHSCALSFDDGTSQAASCDVRTGPSPLILKGDTSDGRLRFVGQ
ncbi:MAG: hypothetical protein R3F59_16835 [Myxococcota bacterium]